jgi:lysophospholipase L1-like esterase
MYERVAKEERCLFVGGVLRGILTDNSLKSDAVHPNGRGYAIMADRIATPINKLLKRANKARR